MALLHSNGQLRTERYGDTEKGCQNLLYSTDDDDDDDKGQVTCYGSNVPPKLPHSSQNNVMHRLPGCTQKLKPETANVRKCETKQLSLSVLTAIFQVNLG